MRNYQFHEAANIFPLDDENLQSLSDDIKINGLQCPIELYDGKIVDGRRRFMACRMGGIEADFVDVKPEDPIAYVLSLNLHRRHLTPSQRSMIAARAREHYDREAKERQKLRKGNQPGATQVNLPDMPKQQARDAAGKAVSVSGKSVDYASRVLNHGSKKLIDAVDANKIAISTAAKLTSRSKAEQDEFLKNFKGKPTARSAGERTEELAELPPEGESRGKGVRMAHEAIAILKKIPKNDALRKRGFQIVSDWIKHNG